MLCVACKIPNGLNISGAGKSMVLTGPGNLPIQERIGGYAITLNVPNDLWDAWAKAHADSALIENKLVFAEEQVEVLKARAWSRARVPDGFSPKFK